MTNVLERSYYTLRGGARAAGRRSHDLDANGLTYLTHFSPRLFTSCAPQQVWELVNIPGGPMGARHWVRAIFSCRLRSSQQSSEGIVASLFYRRRQ